jgi:hypothetical protein
VSADQAGPNTQARGEPQGRRWKATIVALLALGAVSVVPGVARANDGAGNQRFVITASDVDGTGRVVATGPFSGVGDYHLLTHTDNPDGTSTDTDEFELPEGRVFFTDTYTFDIRPEGHSCTWLIEIKGTYTVTGGTGTFTGAAGGGTFTAVGVFVAGRDDAGACLGLDSPPVAFSEVVRGTGTTTLP